MTVIVRQGGRRGFPLFYTSNFHSMHDASDSISAFDVTILSTL